MSEPRVFVVDPSDSVRDRLAATLDGDAPVEGHDSLPAVARAIDDGHVPAVVILGPGIVHDDAIDLADSVYQEQVPVALVQVVKSLDPNHLRDALRVGLSDVVEDDDDLSELAAAVERARPRLRASTTPAAAEDARTARMVAVASGKGGVGCTLIATNLAVALAQHDLKVALVDLDTTSGDASIMLHHQPSLTVLDAVERVDRLDDRAVDGYLSDRLHGVRVLAAPVKGDDTYIDPEAMGGVLDLLGNAADVLVVDVGDTFRPVAMEVLRRADRVLVITSMEVPAVRGARQVLSQLAHAHVPEARTRLIANEGNAQTGLLPGDIEKSLGTDIAASIPSDKYATRSINEGDPLVNRRRSKLARAVRGIADGLVEQLSLRS